MREKLNVSSLFAALAIFLCSSIADLYAEGITSSSVGTVIDYSSSLSGYLEQRHLMKIPVQPADGFHT